jgi:hypothetical protein
MATNEWNESKLIVFDAIQLTLAFLHTRLAISNAFEATAFHSTNAFHF